MRSAPDVYLSYSRLDRDAAQRIAAGLIASGFTVVWDEPIIAPDEHRLRATDTIRNAKAALVLWTPHALDNRVVIEEAAEAARHGKLVGLVLGDTDTRSLPAPLDNQHTITARDAASLVATLAARGLAAAPAEAVAPARIEAAPVPVAAPAAEAVPALPEEPPAQLPAVAAEASSIPAAIIRALESRAAPVRFEVAKPAFVPLPDALVKEAEARRPPLIELKSLEPEALEPPIADPAAPVEVAPATAIAAAPVAVRTRPVLHLRKRAPSASTRSAGASAALVVTGLAVIVVVLLLTSGLLHAFGLGK